MSKSKINPGKKLCTGWELKRAEEQGIVAGLRQGLKLCLYILLDKHGAPKEDVQELAKEITWLGEHLEAGRITWSDVDRVLRENGVGVRLV